MPRFACRFLLILAPWCAASALHAQSPEPRHWAYVKPVRSALPEVKNAAWAKNPIDRFVLARLEKEKLTPSPQAERERLLRRVYLDLIGLPPSVAQVDAFVRDERADAYERVVEELLASPHYGERWARHWLDLARYADSNGFQRDGFRTIWPYRDWVIDAFNRDLPFDQFTLEQIAGDLIEGEPRPSGSGGAKTLPDALTRRSLARKIATGFNRCVTINVEAGTDREENRVNAVFDRVNTTATVWLGTTMGCAQCHHHKYDPFTMTDYYRLFAYFNSTEEETAKGEQAAREFIGPKLTLPLDAKSAARLKVLQAERAKIAAEKDSKKAKQRLNDLDQQIAELAPTTLVMAELPKPRPTYILKRGNFLNKGKAVTPGVPEALHPLPKDAPPNRLGLARWLVDIDNPLVARVAVNRWWAEFFGHGIVATLEDFGAQSDKPTHPELLDWLAVEFMASATPQDKRSVPGGWSMKHIHRLIVTSATYRQSARVSAELVKRDPDNKLYARGPRVRLDAETIRDNALAVSGLLSGKMGGPPVMPPQPPGIWNVTGVVDNTYRPSVGEDRYRRGLYTIWRRSSPYPSMVAFDAPDRTSCIVKRPRTNTPLQALTLLNDAVYVEAALALARNIGAKEGTADERIVYGFRSCLARRPSEREVSLLRQVHEQALTKYQANPAAVKALLQNAPSGERLEPAQWAAWFQVGTVLLNLDEAITK